MQMLPGHETRDNQNGMTRTSASKPQSGTDGPAPTSNNYCADAKRLAKMEGKSRPGSVLERARNMVSAKLGGKDRLEPLPLTDAFSKTPVTYPDGHKPDIVPHYVGARTNSDGAGTKATQPGTMPMSVAPLDPSAL